jgi:hypothetical protein
MSILAKTSPFGICLFAEANTKSVSKLYTLEGFPAFRPSTHWSMDFSIWE